MLDAPQRDALLTSLPDMQLVVLNVLKVPVTCTFYTSYFRELIQARSTVLNGSLLPSLPLKKHTCVICKCYKSWKSNFQCFEELWSQAWLRKIQSLSKLHWHALWNVYYVLMHRAPCNSDRHPLTASKNIHLQESRLASVGLSLGRVLRSVQHMAQIFFKL